jgi:vesicle coat complex subunit
LQVFFVKYNDPIYVKLEKLDIMIRLANSSNVAQVLAELKEYATEVDVDFVRKSVRAIGRYVFKEKFPRKLYSVRRRPLQYDAHTEEIIFT